MIKTLLGSLLFLGVILNGVAPALADYYKYVDSSGAVNMTNKLESVPQKYRSRVKVITDESLSKKDQGAKKEQQPAAQEESAAPQEAAAVPAPQGKFAEFCSAHVWMKPLLYVAGILAAFLVVMKLASVVPSAQLSKLIYLSFFIGVFVLLYKAYIEHVVADSIAVKEKAVNMMKKANVREVPLPGEEPATAMQK